MDMILASVAGSFAVGVPTLYIAFIRGWDKDAALSAMLIAASVGSIAAMLIVEFL